jgi:hypothetical protein
MNVVICRTFLRAALLLVIACPEKYRPRIDRLVNEPFCRAFSSPLVIAVGAVGILTIFTDGL